MFLRILFYRDGECIGCEEIIV